MCKLLLSINPQYVKMIFSGKKKFEFRKCQCRRPVDSILIYCTAPVMRVVGEASLTAILVDAPEHIWEQASEAAGISRDFYDSYYSGCKNAVAYQLGEIEQFSKPKELKEYGIKHAPQSFMYVNG